MPRPVQCYLHRDGKIDGVWKRDKYSMVTLSFEERSLANRIRSRSGNQVD